MKSFARGIALFTVCLFCFHVEICAQNTRATATFARMKSKLDRVPAIDTHDHLRPFADLPGYRETQKGRGMNLAGIWRDSYYIWTNPLTIWQPGMSFDDWWKLAKHDFRNARATSFYRYQLSAFRDLYGVDFNTITDEQARQLDRQIFQNYRDPKWLYHVITERANIELMFNDPYWNRFGHTPTYPFEVFLFNVTTLVRGFHPSEYSAPSNSPYAFADTHGLPVNSLDDYLAVLERMFLDMKDKEAVCLKTTLAYVRTLRFEDVSRERAARAFGKRASALSPEEIKDFEDFIMWRLCELSAKYELPFQIHTGQARIQGSNPMLLVDMIAANRETKFILFHGGFPWVGETGVIVQKYPRNVWVDSCWLPMLSYSLAKRAYHEWLDMFPSDRIMWGADCKHAEGIYGATEFTRRCLAEVLAEKIDRGDLAEEHAESIGRQILRENALELFPQLKEQLWKHKYDKLLPETAQLGG
jgi:predicted TIM-barrel fold metal-dependent hydrolase